MSRRQGTMRRNLFPSGFAAWRAELDRRPRLQMLEVRQQELWLIWSALTLVNAGKEEMICAVFGFPTVQRVLPSEV